MYVNCQGALAIKIWPGIFILKNCEVHQNQKNGTKQPNGYILSAYTKSNEFFSIFFFIWYKFSNINIRQPVQQTDCLIPFYCFTAIALSWWLFSSTSIRMVSFASTLSSSINLAARVSTFLCTYRFNGLAP